MAGGCFLAIKLAKVSSGFFASKGPSEQPGRDRGSKGESPYATGRHWIGQMDRHAPGPDQIPVECGRECCARGTPREGECKVKKAGIIPGPMQILRPVFFRKREGLSPRKKRRYYAFA